MSNLARILSRDQALVRIDVFIRVPDFQGVIGGAGDESAIGEQSDAAYPASVPPQGSDTLCSRFLAWVPDFQGSIHGAGDESAIGEQGDAAYVSVPL